MAQIGDYMARMKRLYAPYVKNEKGKWERAGYSVNVNSVNGIPVSQKVVYTAMFKDAAIRRYQNWLLAPLMGDVPYEKRELRPIPLNSTEYDAYKF